MSDVTKEDEALLAANRSATLLVEEKAAEIEAMREVVRAVEGLLADIGVSDDPDILLTSARSYEDLCQALTAFRAQIGEAGNV